MYERAIDAATVSLQLLLDADLDHVSGTSRLRPHDYAEEIVRSGLPGLRHLIGRAHRAQLDGYVARALDRDLPAVGLTARRGDALRSWLTAYAAATATTTSYNRILDAATAGEGDKPARSTVTAYREALTRLWLLDPLPGWTPSRSPLARLQQAPKHHLADPALAARLLGATAESLMTGASHPDSPTPAPLLGPLFESLATLSVRVLAQAVEARVHHLRTRNGDHEVDMILERPDGRILGIEVKLSTTVHDDDVRHLHWLADNAAGRVLGGVVLHAGPEAYRRSDGIAVIPLSLLGP